MSNRALFDSVRRKLRRLPENIQTAHALAVFREAVRNTPVFRPKDDDPPGYPKVVGGTARAGWQITFGSPGTTLPGKTDPDGNPTIQSGYAVLKSANGPRVVWISNAVPWIVDLEYGLYPNPPKKGTGRTINGYSTQAPQGMRRIAIQYGRDNFVPIARAQFIRLFRPGRAA